MYNATIIDGPYGREVVPVPNEGLPGTTPDLPSKVVPDGPRVLVDDAAMRDQPRFGDSIAASEAERFRPDASVLESVGAAISQWDTTKLINRFARPEFEDEVPIDPYEALQGVGQVLTEDQRDFVLKTAKGDKSFAWAMEKIEEQNLAAQAVGDHPIAGFSASFLDPLWLAVPPAVRLGKAASFAGRSVSAASGAAIAGGVTAAGEGPVSDEEIALSMLMGGAAGAVFYRPGQGLVQRDVEFPKERLDSIVQEVQAKQPKPHYKIIDGKPVEVPRELQTGVQNTDQAAVAAAVDQGFELDSKSRKVGDALQWNMHKSMSSYGPVGKKVADLLYDNNSDLSITSVEAQREAILSGLRVGQHQYEDALRAEMKVRGFGTWATMNPLRSRQAYEAQLDIEKAVQRELFRREQFARGDASAAAVDVPAQITKMADTLDAMHKQALKELKAAGVQGAENLDERPGYLNRRWSSLAIDQVMDRLEAKGLTREAARAKVHSLVSLSIRRAKSMDKDLSDKIGAAVVDRALRKGYFEDAAFNAPGSPSVMAELRDVLKTGGMDSADIERALDVLRVETDDASKAAFLKHRMDLDYKASMRVGDETISVMDLIDGRVASIVDKYNQGVSLQAAMARKGFKTRSDIENLRKELLESVPAEQREQAKDLFDNTIAYLRGDPNGAKLNEHFRLYQQYGRSISLAWSGLWQFTEYANAMAQYGLGKTLKYAAQEIPGFRAIMKPEPTDARSLNNVLADHSVQSLRLRPYIARYEDGYEMDAGSALQLSAQQLGHAVPFANAMKYVHHHQAKMVGNLVLDRIDMAANGNAAAREALAKFGIDSHVMEKLAGEIRAKGFNVDAWDDAVWEATRPAFAKMMDSAVLKGRLGDMPAFAAFDGVGKFIFTYRTFVLAAHNKLLAGNLSRNGAGAVGLVLMYQMPLAMAAVQAQSVVMGDGPLGTDEMIAKAMGQMGGIGLFSEPLKWVTGESNSIGSPAMIPADRGIKLFQSVTNMDPQNAASASLGMVPVMSAVPFIRGVSNAIKE